MKKHVLILTAAVAAALAGPAGAASAHDGPLGLPLTIPQVSEGSFEGTDRLLDPEGPTFPESTSGNRHTAGGNR